MMKYSDTTVFNVGAQTIVNTINCEGIMGAGLALECQLRFPKMFMDYEERCNKKQVQVGKPYVYCDYKDLWIMNFPTKNYWKPPSKIEWIKQGLEYFVKNYERDGISSVAFPKLGCDHGGLDWHDVKVIMEEYLENLNIDVYICLDKDPQPSGVEGIMTELLNNKQEPCWISELRIRDGIATKITNKLPVKRFRELGKIEGVGKQSYRDIFKYLYSIAIKPESKIPQENFITQKETQITTTVINEQKSVTLNAANDKSIEQKNDLSQPKLQIKQDLTKRNNIIVLLKNLLSLDAETLYKLKWSDFTIQDTNENIMLLNKTITKEVWKEIQMIRTKAELNCPLFYNNKGDQLSIASIKKIIRNATQNDNDTIHKEPVKSHAEQLKIDLVF